MAIGGYGWVGRWMDGWMDRQRDRQTDRYCAAMVGSIFVCMLSQCKGTCGNGHHILQT
jgi:allantoicase